MPTLVMPVKILPPELCSKIFLRTIPARFATRLQENSLRSKDRRLKQKIK
jgi:hypothetical protein